MKTALITGITGQDGAILARILLQKGYKVHGLRPYLPVPDTARLDGVEDVILHYADLTDLGSLAHILNHAAPDEIYNLAAISHVHASFGLPEVTANVNGVGVLRLLEAVRLLDMQSNTRIYQASSSEMFGNAPAPQSERTPFEPCSPYGTSKLFGYWTVRNYRDAYAFHASNGILFNHESTMRGEEFVTRKITKAVCEIEAGGDKPLRLGNLEARRDWGHAADYMEGAWMMLQQVLPDDYVLATGETHSVRDFVERAFACVNRLIAWDGQGVLEKGRDKKTGQLLVEVDPVLFRPLEIHCLIGDASRAREKLGWAPRHSFDELVQDMMQGDRIVQDSPVQQPVRKSYAA